MMREDLGTALLHLLGSKDIGHMAIKWIRVQNFLDVIKKTSNGAQEKFDWTCALDE